LKSIRQHQQELQACLLYLLRFCRGWLPCLAVRVC
jgi:hypothetical protein